MGANRTQAVGVSLFLIAFVLIAGGAVGGGVLLFIAGLAVLAGSAVVFMKAKPLEEGQD